MMGRLSHQRSSNQPSHLMLHLLSKLEHKLGRVHLRGLQLIATSLMEEQNLVKFLSAQCY